MTVYLATFDCVRSGACMHTMRACLCVSVFSLQAEERSLWFDKDE